MNAEPILVESKIPAVGRGTITICHRDGPVQVMPFDNAVVNTGRANIVQALGNQFGGVYEGWVSQMAFGSGGAVGGVPRYVEATRTGLWGPIVAVKPVISTINPLNINQVNFTSVLLYEDAIGSVINEMGLVFKNGQYLSITTFGDITKTSVMQLIVNWSVTAV